MTIERLQELKDMINQDYMTEDHYSYGECISEDGEDLISLIDEKISQLSVTDDDVHMTNREWLNSLSDEEFLDVVENLCGEILECDYEGEMLCGECKLDWLKKERVE